AGPRAHAPPHRGGAPPPRSRKTTAGPAHTRRPDPEARRGLLVRCSSVQWIAPPGGSLRERTAPHQDPTSGNAVRPCHARYSGPTAQQGRAPQVRSESSLMHRSLPFYLVGLLLSTAAGCGARSTLEVPAAGNDAGQPSDSGLDGGVDSGPPDGGTLTVDCERSMQFTTPRRPITL